MSARLFVAIDISDEARREVEALIRRCQELDLPARYEPPEKLHITLAFLGATPDERVRSVTDAVEDAAAALSPFEIVLDRVGAFPSQRQPRLLWFGSSATSVQFNAAARRVRAGLQALGYSFDQRPIAHVTFCRFKHRQEGMPELAAPKPVTIQVCDLALYESLPAERTTRYELRLRAPLKTKRM